jgi:hypothetical protein
MVLLMSALVITGCGKKKHHSHADVMGKPTLDKTADQLQQTEFTAYLNHPITPGKNLIWCATMPLVWNGLTDLAGGEIHLAEGDPPIVTELNHKTVTKSDLDDSSFVALVGLTPGILNVIPKALAIKFKGQASPEVLHQIPADLAPGSAVGYSYLFKDLEFEHHFEKLHQGTHFAGTTIRGFGFGTSRSKDMAKAAGQVFIHDYRGKNDFVVEIATRSTGDRLLLAKVHPDSTLAQTIRNVQTRSDTSQGLPPEAETRLKVPLLNFRLTKDYEELLQKHIQCSNTTLNGQLFVMVRQLIQFKLDEEGAKIKSETVMSADTTGTRLGHEPHEPPQLIFDKPFLILMERKGAQNPYFALWVDNTELLAPFSPEKGKP